jgi:hypothetical protein
MYHTTDVTSCVKKPMRQNEVNCTRQIVSKNPGGTRTGVYLLIFRNDARDARDDDDDDDDDDDGNDDENDARPRGVAAAAVAVVVIADGFVIGLPLVAL